MDGQTDKEREKHIYSQNTDILAAVSICPVILAIIHT